MFTDDYIKQRNTSLNFFKNAAKNLQELNKELKEDNDKYDEQQMEQMYKYYENGGMINEY
jgi:putative enterotoxin type A